MASAQGPRLSTPQSFPSAGSSMAPESQQANPPAAAKEPTRARKACDECRRKKVKCEHGQQGTGGSDTAGKRKRSGRTPARTPAPSQGTNQESSSGVAALERAASVEASNRESQAQSSQAVSERPRRLGAGKRKLEEAFDQNPPSNVSKRPRKVPSVSENSSTTNATNTQQVKQRKKPGPKPRNQSDSAPMVVLDTPQTSPPPAECLSPLLPQPFDGNITVSIDLAYHRHMTERLDDMMRHIEQEWRAMCREMHATQNRWDKLLNEMYETRKLMNVWISRFIRQPHNEA